jgi:hypothetical protein
VDQEEEVVVVGAAVEDVAVEDVEVVVAKTCKTSPVVFDGVVVTVSVLILRYARNFRGVYDRSKNLGFQKQRYYRIT